MPKEISATTTLVVNKGFLQLTRTATVTPDMTGTHGTLQLQTVATSYAALVVSGDVAVAGYGFMRNLDTTNFVEIGIEVSSVFHPIIKLKPGEAFIGRLATGSLFAKADTAPVVLEFLVLEN